MDSSVRRTRAVAGDVCVDDRCRMVVVVAPLPDAAVGNGGGGSCCFGSRASLRSYVVPRSFAFRTSVARSGLLAVPCERYMERRLVWSSPSSASKKTSVEELDGGDGSLRIVCCPAGTLDDEGDGVGGGSTVGVDGVTPMRGPLGRLFGGERGVFGEGPGLSTLPSELMSNPSFNITVPSARSACSKSKSVRDTRRVTVRSLLATGASPDGNELGGAGDRGVGRNTEARVGGYADAKSKRSREGGYCAPASVECRGALARPRPRPILSSRYSNIIMLSVYCPYISS
jgi:hypothetical protein